IEFSFNRNSKQSFFFTARTSSPSSEALDHNTENLPRNNQKKINLLRHRLRLVYTSAAATKRRDYSTGFTLFSQTPPALTTPHSRSAR
ncbi:hypothetical protein, partial [Paenacidovorax caeni]|uniref:hypothetical protein n=1 Tax=Paenacidovorax caeni TaxID=343013 RepID=UPI001F166F87